MKALFAMLMLTMFASGAFANGTKCSAANRSSMHASTNPQRTARTEAPRGNPQGRGNAESATRRN